MSATLSSTKKEEIMDIASSLHGYISTLLDARPDTGALNHPDLAGLKTIVYYADLSGWDETIRMGLIVCKHLLDVGRGSEGDEFYEQIVADALKLGIDPL